MKLIKNTLLAVSVTLCLLISLITVVNFYNNNIPLFYEGECFVTPTLWVGTSILEVVENNIAEGKTTVYSLDSGQTIVISMYVLRLLDPEKVDCQ